MCKILIVEDEKPISELIRINLTNAGHDCTCVYDGKAAADLLENTRFDLVLLDVMLPNVDGFELMDYIRPMDNIYGGGSAPWIFQSYSSLQKGMLTTG